MLNIIYVPIEPLEERYSASWYKNIPAFFNRKLGIGKVTVIDGETLTSTVEVGAFLDMNSTVYYKSTQMRVISKMFHEKQIKDGDIFFIADLEFWGIEALRLLAQLNNVKIVITGFLHAASYTTEDAFAVAGYYQKYTELGWLAACDYVYVGSDYHKSAIIARRIQPYAALNEQSDLMGKIKVVGNPLFASDYQDFNSTKKFQLILTNRPDWEKRPNMSLTFAYLLKRRFPELSVVVTTSRATYRSNKQWISDYAKALEKDKVLTIYENLTKEEYHRLLSESMFFLTNSIEENFGYCVVEAMLYNVFPLVPNSCSHPELVNHHKEFIFNDEDEIMDKIDALLKYPRYPQSIAARYYESMENIYKHLYNAYH
jgi:glycosyltransferase involved in cell wall biosynthesis